jgi:hypothetical protein
MIWIESVEYAIRRLTLRNGNSVFTRQELIDSELPRIIKEVSSTGKSPKQTLSRNLQELRKQGVIKFETLGTYRLIR